MAPTPKSYDLVETPKPDAAAVSERLSVANAMERLSVRSADGHGIRVSGAKSKLTQAVLDEEEEQQLDNELLIIRDGLESPQLTVKALIVGVIVGAFNNILALYYGLKTGITPSLNILAGLLGFILTNFILKLRIFREKFTVQENAVIQTCAVATYSLASGAGFASGLLAATETEYETVGDIAGNRASDVIDLTWTRAFAFCIAVALFGFFISFPLRKSMIIDHKLLFPSGTATAVMIQTLHTSKEMAQKQWSVLLKSGTFSFLWNFVIFFFNADGSMIQSWPIFGLKAADYTWELDFDPGTFAVALMLPKKIIFSMMLGSIIAYGMITPILENYRMGTGPNDWFTSSGYDGLEAYYIFTAIAMIMVDSIYSLFKVVYFIVRSWKNRHNKKEGDEGMESEKAREKRELLEKTFLSSEVPLWFWVGGMIVFAAISIIIIALVFPEVKWYQVLVTDLLSPIFSIGIIQGVGMSDWNIASALGKLLMFLMGTWDNSSILPALLLCQCIIVACSQAADLMQDFKTGFIVGARPKSMYIAQFVGAIASAFITPSIWYLMNSAYDIPGSKITAPYGKIYRILAITASEGFGALPSNCGYFMLVAAIVTLVLNSFIDVFEESPNKKLRTIATYCPLPMAIALGMVVGAYFSLEGVIMMVGCMYWAHKNPASFENYRYIVASGLMAGEGIWVLIQIFVSLGGGSAPLLVTVSKADSSS